MRRAWRKRRRIWCGKQSRRKRMSVLETERLSLRQLTTDDTAFIVDLLNQPSFIRNIGDRGVRNPDDAVRYLENGPLASYQKNGFGLYGVVLKDTGALIGMCGLIRRDGLDAVDIGYAFLPPYWSKGYAYEAASAVMADGLNRLGLKRIVAIVSPDNQGSIRVLEKLGLRFERMIRLPDDTEDIKLFS
jgi:RimJ/RimL family protein N-acetyltransferase